MTLPSVLGLKAALLSAAAAGLLGLAGGAYAGYRWEHAIVLEERLAAAKATADAVRLAKEAKDRQFAVDLAAAVAEAAAQAKIAGFREALRMRIGDYVTPAQDARVCVPYGLVRVLNAAVLQTDPGALQLAPGQSDDACSPVKASVLADAIVAWLSVARANAQQLTALQQWVIDNRKAQEPTNDSARRPQ